MITSRIYGYEKLNKLLELWKTKCVTFTSVMRLEKRKQLKEITSNTMRLRARSWLALHDDRELLLSTSVGVTEILTSIAFMQLQQNWLLKFLLAPSYIWMLVLLASACTASVTTRTVNKNTSIIRLLFRLLSKKQL